MIGGVSANSASANFQVGLLARADAQTSAQEVASSVASRRVKARAKEELTPEQQRQIEALKQTDARVHRHEQAHIAVGGDLIRGGATYSYTIGPDQKRYAVAGEVSIDTSPANTPEATIPKAQHIHATALAPADPSPQDRGVASIAVQMENKARSEVRAKQSQQSPEPAQSVSTAAASASAASAATSAAAAASLVFYRAVQQSATQTILGSTLDLFA